MLEKKKVLVMRLQFHYSGESSFKCINNYTTLIGRGIYKTKKNNIPIHEQKGL